MNICLCIYHLEAMIVYASGEVFLLKLVLRRPFFQLLERQLESLVLGVWRKPRTVRESLFCFFEDVYKRDGNICDFIYFEHRYQCLGFRWRETLCMQNKNIFSAWTSSVHAILPGFILSSKVHFVTHGSFAIL